MPAVVTEIWVYLSEGPLFWLTATLGAYLVAHWLYLRTGERPIVNAVAIAILILSGILEATDTDYQQYFEGAQFVHFMLGPAVVALAVPLYENRRAVGKMIIPIAAALSAGAVTAVVSAVAITMALGGSAESVMSMAPKSATSPIAMGIAEQTGGLPSLTAGLVILTGILGAVLATPLFGILRIRDPRAVGFSLGLTAHGIGTARAFQISELAGTFAAIALGLTGVVMAFLVPAIVPFFSP